MCRMPAFVFNIRLDGKNEGCVKVTLEDGQSLKDARGMQRHAKSLTSCTLPCASCNLSLPGARWRSSLAGLDICRSYCSPSC